MTPNRPPAPAPPDPWKDVTAARVPAEHLAALAPVRDQPDVRVHRAGDLAWVRWPAGKLEAVRCLLPVTGAEFFVHRDGLWFRFGSRLPTAEIPPAGDGLPVAAVLVPGRCDPVPPDRPAAKPVLLRAVRGGEPRTVAALVCRAADLLAWADAATTAEIESVRAARSGDRVVLLGGRLPAIPGATRYWGVDLLVPVGFRPDPDLSAAALRAAVGTSADELVLLDADGAEVIPRGAFEPLTRAGVRLAHSGEPGHPRSGSP